MYVCDECGSSNIETRMWVKVNTDEVVDGSGCGDRDDNWCNGCEEHVKFMTEEEFKEQQKEDV